MGCLDLCYQIGQKEEKFFALARILILALANADRILILFWKLYVIGMSVAVFQFKEKIRTWVATSNAS